MIKTKKAFTIVETLLSMAGISFIILIIGYTILHIVNVYQKGISIRDVNKVADQIISDMQASIVGSNGIRCAFKEEGKAVMSTKSSDDETCKSLYDLTSGTGTRIQGGAICAERYTYVWNYGPALQKVQNIKDKDDRESAMRELFRYKRSNGDVKLVRFAKFEDRTRAYCQGGAVANAGVPKLISENDHEMSDEKTIIELVEANERELALHSILVTSSAPDEKTNQALYEIEFVLGTFNNNLLMTSDAQCKNLSSKEFLADGSVDDSKTASESDLSYCAINKFNFSARGLKGRGIW